MEVTTATDAPNVLRPTIGVWQAVALYTCAVLGAGVLVLPGQAASLAGPASVLAWGFSALLGIPLALTFAALATRYPDAGGVASYATRAFGQRAGGVTGWWYFIAGSVGQTVVPLTGGYYIAPALGLPARYAYPIAAVVLATAVATNLIGVRMSSRVQITLAAAVAVILLVTAMVAVPNAQPDAFTPFAPRGIDGIGQAVIVLFFAFAGWEAVAHLAAEFHDVKRDLTRATIITVAIVIVLYLAVAFAVVATGAYGSPATDNVAIGLILSRGLGVGATIAMAVAAAIICLGTTNAFVASISRLGYALGRDGWLPRPLARINSRSVPAAGVWTVGGIGATGLLLAFLRGWGTQDIVYIPSVLVLTTYLLGCASAARLLHGRARALALIALVLLLAVTPFASWRLLLPSPSLSPRSGTDRWPRGLAQAAPAAGRADEPVARTLGRLREFNATQVELHERLLLLNRPWEEELMHWAYDGHAWELHGHQLPPPGRGHSVTASGWCPGRRNAARSR